jgi:hypothetical protein
MLEHIIKIGEEEPVFCQLTKDSIVLCDSEGFERAKSILCYFEKDSNGNPDYDYLWQEGDDIENEIISIEHLSEKEILIKIGKEQTIRIFRFLEPFDLERLREMNYDIRDRWFSNWKEIYAFTEFKNCETWMEWDSFLKGTYMGRFGLNVEHKVF